MPFNASMQIVGVFSIILIALVFIIFYRLNYYNLQTTIINPRWQKDGIIKIKGFDKSDFSYIHARKKGLLFVYFLKIIWNKERAIFVDHIKQIEKRKDEHWCGWRLGGCGWGPLRPTCRVALDEESRLIDSQPKK